ncbi:MAG: hypothetical protein EBZ50_03140 [Alphaproteobacteria bacterium]|nr:hypothetical protein [Alphaproteobacteria bacterium]
MLPTRTFLPFSPDYAFAAAQVVTISGVTYQPGDAIPKGAISERRLRQLYELRRIAPHAPDFLFNGPASPAPTAPEPDEPAAAPPADDAIAADDAPPPPARSRRQRTVA